MAVNNTTIIAEVSTQEIVADVHTTFSGERLPTEWGSIGGDISNQTDLQAELDDKVSEAELNSAIGDADKYIEYSFTNQSSFTVTHNFIRKPVVQIIEDTTQKDVIAEVEHISDNQISITLSQNLSGLIILRA